MVVLALYAWWQIGEPGRRARQVHQQIHPGISYQDVEGLLTGRYYCFYEVAAEGAWKGISRDEFADVKKLQSDRKPVQRRLNLTFMGTSPGRVSFFVQIDGNGKVSEVMAPRGWD